MNTKSSRIRGRVWVIRDADGRAIESIDTDMIFHNAHLAITDLAKMGPHTFGNLPGWQDFPTKAAKGDIVVTGANFGAGSSRQQAVDCFAALGIGLLICESVGAIYRRNAINSGFPMLIAPGIAAPGLHEPRLLEDGQIVEADVKTGAIYREDGTLLIQGRPMSGVEFDIYQAGSLFEYGRVLDAQGAESTRV